MISKDHLQLNNSSFTNVSSKKLDMQLNIINL